MAAHQQCGNKVSTRARKESFAVEIKVERWATMKFVIGEITFVLQDESVAGRNIASPEPLNSFASGIMPFYLLDGPSYCFMCSF